MLKLKCCNPEIISSLAKAGHGDKILIADGNYPLYTKTSDVTKRIFLYLNAGAPTVSEILASISSICPIESATLMSPKDNSVPQVHNEIKTLLPDIEYASLNRYDFYNACCDSNVILAIASGDKRKCANVLLTIGCVV